MNETLPSKYYLTHARELFNYVENDCSQLLSSCHRQYLSEINLLNENAQCLLVRCLTRKPKYIKLSSLNYSEIDAREEALDELKRKHYLRIPNTDDWAALAECLTKAELVKSLKYAPVKIKSSTIKTELVQHALQHLNGDETHLSPLLENFVARQRSDIADYLFFLFFGDLKNRFQQFAMRDLGVMRTRKSAKMIARFDTADEAKSAFNLEKCRRDFLANPSKLKFQTADYLQQATAVGQSAQQVRDQLLLSVGNEILIDDAPRAILLWKQSKAPTAIEKWVRETYKRFDRNELKAELEQLRKKELEPAAKIFVEDFYARKYQGKRTSLFTDMLRENGRTIAIDEAYVGDVEAGVVDHYRGNGQQAYFTENKFWRTLFALTFWDLLFGSKHAQFSEFERLPTQLKRNTFHAQQRDEIDRCLDQFNSPLALLTLLTHRCVIHYGKPNGIFRWSANILDAITPALKSDNAANLAKVLKRMSVNYALSKDGYPDLMIVVDNSLQFEEIKAPGDVLRPNQLLSINRLREAGLDVNVTQVKWQSNPNQIYAVVDIETTGGRKGSNAITEIAVVQIRNNQVIGEWSTLINPRRHIPAHITRLTGIDNALVANAPTFAEIADKLEQQLRDSIFVAHNVGFDYGFIKAAYQSISRPFKKPRFCTVSNSRKAFPGLKSYSLGALTEHFDIDLKTHHRALSDARATADLFCLIQQTRAFDQSNKHHQHV